MSRSDGEFPKFEKVSLGSDDWPEGYFDQSYKCIGCGKTWPQHKAFIPTLCCNTGVKTVSGAPEVRWPEAVFALKETLFNSLYEKWNEGVEDDQLMWEDIKSDGEVDPIKLAGEVDDLIHTMNADRAHQ